MEPALELENNNPMMGHILERLWAPMFGCHVASPPDFEVCHVHHQTNS